MDMEARPLLQAENTCVSYSWGRFVAVCGIEPAGNV